MHYKPQTRSQSQFQYRSRRFIVALLFCLFAVSQGLAQDKYFNGQITYKLSYLDSAQNPVDANELGLDTVMYYFISEGNYKSYGQEGKIKQLYNYITNQYVFMHNEEVKVFDAAMKFPANVKITASNESITVLDHLCQKVVFESDLGITTYYYSQELIADSYYFDRHHFGNWKLYLHTTRGALSLKYITQMAKGLTQIAEAIEINQHDMKPSDFDLDILKMEAGS